MRHFKPNFLQFWLGVLICATAMSAPADSATDQVKLADANTAFAFDLFGQIVHEQPDVNVFISPFSISTVLQMIENGAAGKTKQEMREVLHTADLPTNALNAACLGLNQSLNSQTNVILELANAIWYQQGIPLKPGFISANKEFFRAELGAVDFGSPRSAQTINDWANHNTQGKIRQVVSWPFPPATRLVLANAIYFKGKWQMPFNTKDTRPHAFHLVHGGEKRVPMMRRHGHFDYKQGDGYQAARLPYAGRRLWMEVFLPGPNSNLANLLVRFNAKSGRAKMLEGFFEREGTLALPRFKLEYRVNLNDSLQALGMERAFRDADFSAMSREPLELSEVKQKSFLEVNEAGTEAAAVTVGMMRATAVLRPIKPFEMIVDRPFFFVIEDSQTQSILFMGVMYDPTT